MGTDDQRRACAFYYIHSTTRGRGFPELIMLLADQDVVTVPSVRLSLMLEDLLAPTPTLIRIAASITLGRQVTVLEYSAHTIHHCHYGLERL